jgi:hypothetical protein
MYRRAVIMVAACLAVAACSSFGDNAGDARSSLSGGFGSNTDTYGTNRRPDVYGGFTQPSLPTMGAVGYGK